jgi:isopenicillin-N epimerase
MPLFKAQGYQGFGSFQSENPEELIRISDKDYKPPRREISLKRFSHPLSFGTTTRTECFGLDPTWTFINHGAFGAACKPALEVSFAWQHYTEEQPLRFIDRELFPLLCYSIRRVAAFVHAKPTSIAIVPNATYALTSVIQSHRIISGSVICTLDIGYGSLKKMALQSLSSKSLDKELYISLNINIPCSRSDLIVQIIQKVPLNCSLFIIDHITSNTGIVLPIKEIIDGIRLKIPSCIILIDGAHGLGSIDLNLDELGADYYVSNFHKWLCSTRGVGLLYSRTPELASRVRAAVVSHGFGAGYTSEFIWDGCRDYSMAVGIPELLDWWTEEDFLAKSRKYCRDLLINAAELLTACWKSRSHMDLYDGSYSHMACIELPLSCLPPGACIDEHNKIVNCTTTHSKMLQDALHYAFKIEVPVKTLPSHVGDTRSYVRISAMIYNTMDEYKKLADAVLQLKWLINEKGEIELETPVSMI